MKTKHAFCCRWNDYPESANTTVMSTSHLSHLVLKNSLCVACRGFAYSS